MKHYFLIFLVTLLFLSCHSNNSPEGFIPDSSSQVQIINDMMNVPEAERTYYHYFQLAISFAESGESPHAVKYWIEKSFENNTPKTCELLIFMISNRSQWEIISSYAHVVFPLMEDKACRKL